MDMTLLDREIRDLTARRDIHTLLCRYMRAQDRLLPDLHLGVFAPDAYVDCGPYKGDAAGFVRFAQGFLAETKSSHHLIGQADITVEGDRASGEVYFIAQHRVIEDGAEKDLFVSGRYIDEYCRRDGRWLIHRRRELVDWVRSDPAADGFLTAMPGLNLGDRGDADFSTTRAWPPACSGSERKPHDE